MEQLRKKHAKQTSQAAASGALVLNTAKRNDKKSRDVWFSNYESNAQGNATGNYGDAFVPEGYATAQAILDGTTSAETQAAIGTAPHATIYTPVNYNAPISFSVCLGGNADMMIPPNEFLTLAPWDSAPATAPQLFIGGMNTGSAGIYTVPQSGTYVVDSTICWNGESYTNNSNVGSRTAQLVLTRTEVTTGQQVQYVIAYTNGIPSATDIFDTVMYLHTLGQFLRGDTLQIQVQQTSGAILQIAHGIRTQWSLQPVYAPTLNKANTVSIAH